MRYLSARRQDRATSHAGLAALRDAAGQSRDTLATPAVHDTLARSGAPLAGGVRGEFEARVGGDFSGVRVHTDEAAARSARDMGALAYTVGNHVVFGGGRFAPGTGEGNKLLAHELTHVNQQRGAPGAGGPLRISNAGEGAAQAAQSGHAAAHAARAAVAGGLQRAPDPKDVDRFDKQIAKVKALDSFKKLDASHLTEFQEIVDLTRKKDNPLYYSGKLELLFTTKESGAAAQAAKQSAEIKGAADTETKRVGKQSEPARLREEGISKTRAKKFKPATGLDGTIFAIDASDVTDIAVRAQVQLVKKGTGTDADVVNVEKLEDVIEKRASTLGYSLDVAFLKKSGPNIFTVGVDTSEWTVADNWVGDDVGLVHELHHLMGLDQDRYDYIEGHADNEDMDIPDRVHWFREEFKKTIANDDESMMNTGARVPLDDDICRVAGKRTTGDVDACVKLRADARAAKLKPAIDQALDWLTKAAAAPAARRTKAAGVFAAAPSMKALDAAIAASRAPLDAKNMQFFSEIAGECADRPAFARHLATREIGLCPALLALGTADQARALLLEALHLGGIGAVSGEKDCPSGCDTVCGTLDNGKAWARFIECSAAP